MMPPGSVSPTLSIYILAGMVIGGGIGAKKLEAYGDEVLRVVSAA